MHQTLYYYAALFVALGIDDTQGRLAPRVSLSLERLLSRDGTVTYSSSCSNYPDVETGVGEAVSMSKTAADTLNGENPFEDPNPFGASWEAIREAIFGTENITPEATLIGMYNQIANTGSGVTIHCGEPQAAINAGAERCIQFVDNNSPYLDAYQLSLDNSDPTNQNYIDDKALGFSDGQNIVICPETLPNGQRGFKLLANLQPAPGDDIEQFKSSYASLFTHEFSHLYGTKDFKQVYGYGFQAAKQIATDTANGNNAFDSDAGERPAPGNNADSFAFFALAVSQISDPTMESFDWVEGNAKPKVGP